MLKKLTAIRIIVSILIGILTIRLFYLQIINGSRLAKAASSQRVSQIEIDKVRGKILDRFGVPFTDRSTSTYCVLFPQTFKDMNQELEEVTSILEIDGEDIKKQFNIKNQPILLKINEEKKTRLKELNISGLSTIEVLNRYDEASLARHVVGYINKIDETGESGIEKAYDLNLITDKEIKVGVVTDALFNTIKGYGYRLIGAGIDEKTTNIKTTLDYDIQKIVESVMENYHMTGAVVVESIHNGDVVAMASKPDYDQNNIAQFLENSNSALFNRAVAAYNLGSIFKIIDVAAFLQQGGDPSTVYYCPGYATVGDTEFRCSSYSIGGHGYVDLERAFAESCNTYFINMGIRMGTKPLTDMAKRFGLATYTGLNMQGINESPGKLPDFNKNLKDGNAANVSIGQGDVMATPLQVADMVATVANGGIKNKVNIIDSFVDLNMKKQKIIRDDSATRVIDAKIAESIKFMMEQVTTTGTGTRANLSKYGGAAGKTGSAETGQMIGEKKLTHAWFAGYFPLKSPKYAISVFVEGGDSGGRNAAPIFAEIAQKIMELGL